MGGYSHQFVEKYIGLVGFGSDRATDEASLTVYLQQFSDDELMSVLCRRLSDQEIDEFVDLISRTLRRHLNDEEYHSLFLKDPDHHH